MRPSLNAPAEPSPAHRTFRLWLAIAGGMLSALGTPDQETAFLANARATVATLAAHGVAVELPVAANPSLAQLQRALAPHILFEVHINPEMRVKVSRGSAEPILTSGRWRFFVARVENTSGTTASLQGETPPRSGQPAATRDAWLEWRVIDEANLPAKLSGQPVEYRLVALRPNALGRREARFSLHVGQGTQDLGFRSEVDILFQCSPPP